MLNGASSPSASFYGLGTPPQNMWSCNALPSHVCLFFRHRRAILDTMILLILLCFIVWVPENTPAELSMDMTATGIPVVGGIALIVMLRLTYRRSSWHVGVVKRILLRATFIHLLGAVLWVVEESKLMPCPYPITFHSVWHLCSAHSLVAW